MPHTPRPTTLATVTLLALASAALAQTPAAPTSPAKPIEPAKSEPKKDAASTGYPATVTKKLWATTDLRGKKAPALVAEAWRLEGKDIKAPDLKGKTILLDFWGIGCPPCRTLIPELENWQEKYKNDLVIIGVGSDTPKALDNFEDLRNGKIKYALAIDTQNRTNRDVGVEGIPHVLVISSDGIVRWQGFPLWQEEQLTEDKLKQIIDTDKAARGGAAAKPAETTPAATKPEASATAKPGETKPEVKPPEKKG